MRFTGSRFFWFACAFEAALLPVAAGLAYLLHSPLLSDLHWSVPDLLLGFIASAPLYVLFVGMLHSSFPPFARIRRLLEHKLHPLFASWTVPQLGLLSLLAGLGEEVLFRGVIQGALSSAAGPVVALLIASALFGCVHFITLGYAVVAAAIGVYLGLLWLWSGNLLTPIVTHATYDFVALVALLRGPGSRDGHSQRE